jgi:hypothetical protein
MSLDEKDLELVARVVESVIEKTAAPRPVPGAEVSEPLRAHFEEMERAPKPRVFSCRGILTTPYTSPSSGGGKYEIPNILAWREEVAIRVQETLTGDNAGKWRVLDVAAVDDSALVAACDKAARLRLGGQLEMAEQKRDTRGISELGNQVAKIAMHMRWVHGAQRRIRWCVGKHLGEISGLELTESVEGSSLYPGAEPPKPRQHDVAPVVRAPEPTTIASAAPAPPTPSSITSPLDSRLSSPRRPRPRDDNATLGGPTSGPHEG